MNQTIFTSHCIAGFVNCQPAKTDTEDEAQA